MPKIVAFGDSFTQGVGLCKLHSTPEETSPCDFAWPNLVAKKLGYDVLNLSLGGGSIKETAYFMSQHMHEIEHGDIVAILWTLGTDRTCIIQNTDEDVPGSIRGVVQYGPWMLDSDLEKDQRIARTMMFDCRTRADQLFNAGAYMKLANDIAKQRTPHVLNLAQACIKHTRYAELHNIITDEIHPHHIVDQDWVDFKFVETFGLYDPNITPEYTEYDQHYSREMHEHFSNKIDSYIRQKWM